MMMSFYRGGAFWLGVVVFIWVGYLFIGGNRVIKPDSSEAVYEQNKNNPLFIKQMTESLFYTEAKQKNLSDYHYKRLKAMVNKKMPEYSEKKLQTFKYLGELQQKINKVEALFKSLKEVKIPSKKEGITFSCGIVIFDIDDMQGVLNIFENHKLVRKFKADFTKQLATVAYSDMLIWLKVSNLPLFHTSIFVDKEDEGKIKEIVKLLTELQNTKVR